MSTFTCSRIACVQRITISFIFFPSEFFIFLFKKKSFSSSFVVVSRPTPGLSEIISKIFLYRRIQPLNFTSRDTLRGHLYDEH